MFDINKLFEPEALIKRAADEKPEEKQPELSKPEQPKTPEYYLELFDPAEKARREHKKKEEEESKQKGIEQRQKTKDDKERAYWENVNRIFEFKEQAPTGDVAKYFKSVDTLMHPDIQPGKFKAKDVLPGIEATREEINQAYQALEKLAEEHKSSPRDIISKTSTEDFRNLIKNLVIRNRKPAEQQAASPEQQVIKDMLQSVVSEPAPIQLAPPEHQVREWLQSQRSKYKTYNIIPVKKTSLEGVQTDEEIIENILGLQEDIDAGHKIETYDPETSSVKLTHPEGGKMPKTELDARSQVLRNIQETGNKAALDKVRGHLDKADQELTKTGEGTLSAIYQHLKSQYTDLIRNPELGLISEYQIHKTLADPKEGILAFWERALATDKQLGGKLGLKPFNEYSIEEQIAFSDAYLKKQLVKYQQDLAERGQVKKADELRELVPSKNRKAKQWLESVISSGMHPKENRVLTPDEINSYKSILERVNKSIEINPFLSREDLSVYDEKFTLKDKVREKYQQALNPRWWWKQQLKHQRGLTASDSAIDDVIDNTIQHSTIEGDIHPDTALSIDRDPIEVLRDMQKDYNRRKRKGELKPDEQRPNLSGLYKYLSDKVDNVEAALTPLSYALKSIYQDRKDPFTGKSINLYEWLKKHHQPKK